MQKLVPMLALAAAFVGALAPAPAVVGTAAFAQAKPAAPRDSGDSLYRRARAALSDGDYERAAETFAQLRGRYPKSAYAADSYYWEAFALSRDGSSSRLRRAVTLLDAQFKEYAAAATLKSGEAKTLATRLKGQLARSGDANAAADVMESAVSVAADARRAQADAARSERNAGRAARQAAAPDGARWSPGPPGCKSEEDDDRVEALNALMQMNADQAMPILKKVLERRDPCSELLRR